MCDFHSTLNSLKSIQDDKLILKTLIAIRKEVDWPKHADNINVLVKSGSLKYIVQCLQSNHKNIIDASLSILGNCCMDLKCVTEIRHHNIITVLNLLLKRYELKEDSINGRVFRIIGNMCQQNKNFAFGIVEGKPQTVTNIVDVLKLAGNDDCKDVSPGTIIMAIRCIRELLNSTTVIKLVTVFGVLKPLGLILIKYSGQWKENGQNEKLLHTIIKALHEFSKYNCSHSILEMRNTDKGNALICLSDILLLAPKKIVKIVMNFIRMSKLQSDLPVPEICDSFMTALQNRRVIQEFHGEYIEYIQSLCYLFDHPANRNSNRCGKSIPILLEALNDFKTVSKTTLICSILIIATLNKCKYNKDLILEQLKCDVVKVLIAKLEWVGGSSKMLHLKHKEEKKRKYRSAKTFNGSKRIGLPINELKQPASNVSSSDEEDLLTYGRNLNPCSSPSSSSDSDMTCCSWSTIQLHSRSLSNLCDSSEFDSDDYSPICSEADKSEFSSDNRDKINMDFDTVQEIDYDDDDDGDDVENLGNIGKIGPNLRNLKVRLSLEILKLLKTFINLEAPNPQLASRDLLVALVNANNFLEANTSHEAEGVRIACLISHCRDHLIALMKTDFIPIIYEMTHFQHSASCIRCTQFQHIGVTILCKFTDLVESEAGKGDIAHILLCGNDDLKKHVILTVPYVARNKSFLSKLMVNCGGLEMLIKLLKEETECRKKAVKVLSLLSSEKLHISNPKKSASLQRLVISTQKYKLKDGCSEAVCFRLDDGSTIKADRQLLSLKCDYFNILLNGEFKESTETEILLHNVSSKALKCLFTLLQLDIGKTKKIRLDLDLPSILDVIALCDKYLLLDLCVSLTDCVEQCWISSVTVPTIYQWSVESGTNLLRIESVAFALVGNMVHNERIVMFNKLFNLGYTEEIISDIQKLLLRYLQMKICPVLNEF